MKTQGVQGDDSTHPLEPAPGTSTKNRSARAWAYFVVCSLALAALWPAVNPEMEDSFPLSNYPMFARHRGKPTIYQMVGFKDDKSEHKLSPSLIGTREVLQAKVIIQRAAGGGRAAREELCTQVAKRVAQRAKKSKHYAAIRSVEMLRVRFDPIEYYEKGPKPMSRRSLVRCLVEGAEK